jgi:hypothetical protein
MTQTQRASSPSSRLDPGSFGGLVQSWERSLRDRQFAATISNYRIAWLQLADHIEAPGIPTLAADIKREHVEDYVTSMRDKHAPATAATRY